MSDINRVNGLLRAVPLDYAALPAGDRFRAGPGAALADPPSDALELSDIGAVLSRLAETPGVRVAKIARIRAAIAAGTYESPHKIDAVVDRLLPELLR